MLQQFYLASIGVETQAKFSKLSTCQSVEAHIDEGDH